jgi:hypothetical protein
MHEGGRRARAVDVPVHPPAAFLRNYILRRGFLDGSAGLILSVVNACSVLLKFAKLWELQRTAGSPTTSADSRGHASDSRLSASKPQARLPGDKSRVGN